MSPTPTDFSLLNHYTVFLYPFFHDIGPNNRNARIRALDESWAPWWSRLGDVATVLDSTYFFLPHIREVLFPETLAFRDQPPGPGYENWVTEISQLNRNGLSYLCQRIGPEKIIRVTYKPEHLQQIKRFEVFEQRDKQTVSTGLLGEMEWIDALLFPSGVGFLLLKTKLRQERPRLSQLVDLNYFLRMVHAPNLAWTLPKLHFDNLLNKATVRNLMDFLTQGVASDLQSITDLSLWHGNDASRSNRLSETESGQVYGERCHIFSYACVDLKDDGSPNGVFGSLKDRLVFEYASSLAIGDSINDPTWIPSAEYQERLTLNNQFSMWQAWTGMALKDSVIFLGTADIPFNKSTLPANVEQDYLPLYVYSLYQEYQLFSFADQLMRKGAYAAKHLIEVRALMDRFIEFRMRYWFNEVTRKPLGSELYSKFQKALESTALFDLVSLQVKDLKEYYEERRRRRIDVLLNIFTFVFLPVGAAIGIFGMTFFNGTWTKFLIVMLVVLITSLGLWRWWTEDVGPKVD